MLSHCANSECSKPFLKLREGKLFLVETIAIAFPAALNTRTDASHRKPPKRVEHFWLCDDCAPSWTLIQDGNRGLALVPIAPEAGAHKGKSAQPYRDVI